jgi:hydroxyacylglutathione hydrolase
MMKWERMPLGPLQTNCYIVWNEEKENEALIIDPGGDAKRLQQWVTEKGLKPLAIILTHTHFDHIGAVEEIRTTYSIPVYVHKEEQHWLNNPEMNGSGKYPMIPDIYVNKADKVIQGEKKMKIGTFAFQVYETPGHSPGSISLYFEEEAVVFSGDALFLGSIGRTDLFGGNHQQLLHSIHTKLLTLPEETEVASGHGDITTISREMDSNPFLNGF